MRADLALQLLSDMLLTALLITAPLLAVTLVVGLLVSIVQVVTQVQETSLTFIPKIVAAVIVLVVCGSWMLKRLVAFAVNLIANMPAYF
jgi:flagellar biosynthetic protein FliQ